VRVNSYAHVTDSILFDRVSVGRHAKIHRAIVDKSVEIPPGIEIGFDHDADRARGFTVTESGIVVIGKSDSVLSPVPDPHFASAATKPSVPPGNQ
jgi:glucose-1-phosphate adenylyltransferase